MALTAFPAVTFNTSTGSDSAASGAGPATAITGTANASTSGASTTVSLGGSPDLSGVATDGSAVLWLKGRGFYRIDTVDNSAKTVVVETAVNVSTPCDWAIGGKRATIQQTDSLLLFGATSAGVAADSGGSGAQGRWAIVLEDDQTLATSTLIITCTGGTGDLVIRSDSTTRRVINQTANAANFTISPAIRLRFQYIKLTNSNGTKTAANGVITGASGTTLFDNCILGDATNQLRSAAVRSGNSPLFVFNNTAVRNCTSAGVGGTNHLITVNAYGSEFSNNGTHGVYTTGGSFINCLFAHNTNSGLNLDSGTLFLYGNTFDSNGDNGVLCNTNNLTSSNLVINNIFTGHNGAGDNGISFTGTSPQVAPRYNVFYDNTTNANGVTLDSTNQTAVDPQYTNDASGTRDYTPGNTALRGTAMPMGTFGETGATSYLYPGAVQPQGSGGSGGGSFMGNLRGNTQ